MRLGGATVAGHLDAELPAVEHGAVHGVDGILGVPLVVEADEGEAAALAGEAVAGDVDVAHLAVLLEHPLQRLGRRAVRQVVHFQRGHPLDVRRHPPVTHVGVIL